jgi:hypothetical protein
VGKTTTRMVCYKSCRPVDEITTDSRSALSDLTDTCMYNDADPPVEYIVTGENESSGSFLSSPPAGPDESILFSTVTLPFKLEDEYSQTSSLINDHRNRRRDSNSTTSNSTPPQNNGGATGVLDMDDSSHERVEWTRTSKRTKFAQKRLESWIQLFPSSVVAICDFSKGST